MDSQVENDLMGKCLWGAEYVKESRDYHPSTLLSLYLLGAFRKCPISCRISFHFEILVSFFSY